MKHSFVGLTALGLSVTLGTSLLAGAAQAQELAPKTKLVGFAQLPADTFAAGPQSGANDGTGKPITGNGRTGPFPGQPVQGFSGIQFAPGSLSSFYILSDNGYGAQANSADYLLRIQRVNPEFTVGFRALNKTIHLGNGKAAHEGFVQLADPDHKVSFPIVRESTPERWLTGADFDIESFVIDRKGDLWVGDEFGPFILHTDKNGKLLEAPIPTPNVVEGELTDDSFVRAPQNPSLQGAAPNLGSSKGFEGMAFSPDKKTLYPLLEGTVNGDPANSLRIYEFDVKTSSFVGFIGYYSAPEGRSIGDFTPINDREFLVIERDNFEGPAAKFKKIFKVNLSKLDTQGYVEKVLVVDLLQVQDPNDVNKDGSTSFNFPFQTIEDVLVVAPDTILVANDNNYPFSAGRQKGSDNDEIILLDLEQPLKLDPRLLLLK